MLSFDVKYWVNFPRDPWGAPPAALSSGLILHAAKMQQGGPRSKRVYLDSWRFISWRAGDWYSVPRVFATLQSNLAWRRQNRSAEAFWAHDCRFKKVLMKNWCTNDERTRGAFISRLKKRAQEIGRKKRLGAGFIVRESDSLSRTAHFSFRNRRRGNAKWTSFWVMKMDAGFLLVCAFWAPRVFHCGEDYIAKWMNYAKQEWMNVNYTLLPLLCFRFSSHGINHCWFYFIPIIVVLNVEIDLMHHPGHCPHYKKIANKNNALYFWRINTRDY
jgi:hypothetical protein